MFSSLRVYASFLGRILLSFIFLLSGIVKIMNWPETAASMSSHGLPAVPLLLSLAIAVEVLGGLALLLGWHTRYAALLLFLYLIPTTLVYHDFWAFQGLERQMQTINFLKNLAIMGGLLEFFAVGANALSLDASVSRSRFGFLRSWPGVRRPF